MTHTVSAIAAIAFRDFLKFLRDPPRIVATFVFPLVFILVLGGTFARRVDLGFDYRTFIYLGVLGQTLFQSAAMGYISLIQDREADFSQAIFVAPVSRYAIVFGKIVGESMVALSQGAVILFLGPVVGVPMSIAQVATLVPVLMVVCLFGGAFGLLVMANLSNQRSAQQVFPFVMLPQFFLAGVFGPLDTQAWYLTVPSRLAPMRYAVDLTRAVYYGDDPVAQLTVADHPAVSLTVALSLFGVFLALGTALFVRQERNR